MYAEHAYLSGLYNAPGSTAAYARTGGAYARQGAEDPINFGEDEEDPPLDVAPARTRAGYPAADVVRQLTVALQQSGAESAAKSLHYSADLITSGCYDHWQKLLWDYVIDHVGIASPRIFFFLRRQFAALDAAKARAEVEVFYREPVNQRMLAECVLVARLCNRKPTLKWPRVPPETHTDEWVSSIFDKVPDSPLVRRVWTQGMDARIALRVGNEYVAAVDAGATEKALFVIKWLMEEESYVRRSTKSFICAQGRGPAALPEKQRKSAGMYILAISAEIYRDLAARSKIKMNEEFQALIQLYSTPDKRLSAKRRNDILILIVQILCEVPRMAIPSAPVLVADQASLLRALNHSQGFFREVLVYDAPAAPIQKELKKKKVVVKGEKALTAKEKKELKIKEQMEAMDSMVSQLYGLG